jgi:hypothetical protein
VKRFRRPKLKDGQLLVYWGRLPHDEPDIIYSWQGDSSMKRDSSLLCYHFGSRRPDPLAKPLYSKMEPSFLEELELRGYDLTTLRFSIMKKTANSETDRGMTDEL